eukprot:m.267808 g.267808  ORF g.267808 m.267808 type:complete len:692 (+) comp40523_c0_seq6:329-2404(+)
MLLLQLMASLGVYFAVIEGEEDYPPWASGTCALKPKRTAVRKNLTQLTQDEELRYRLVFKELMRRDTTSPGNNCTYFNIAKHHGYFSAYCQHESSTCFEKQFLPWHRMQMFEIEQAGQTIDPEFSLPYWDFTNLYASSPNETVLDVLPKLFTNETFFNPLTNTTEPNPLKSGYVIPAVKGVPYQPLPYPGNKMVRNLGNENGTLDSFRQQICHVFQTFSTYDDFSFHLECPHNLIHDFIGGGTEYSMTSQRFTSFDPIFYSYHSMIDRIWAMWSLRYPYGDGTSTAMTNETIFEPFGPTWPYRDVLDHEGKLGYRYDFLDKSFDFCKPREPGFALYIHFARIPIVYNASYRVRLIADLDAIAGESHSPGILHKRDVIAEVAIPISMGQYDPQTRGFVRKNCTSPKCFPRCYGGSVSISSPELIEEYSRPFNLSDKVFLDVYNSKTGSSIDLSEGLSISNLKSRLLAAKTELQETPRLQITAGFVTPQPIQCQKVSEKEISVDWRFQPPYVSKYPDCVAYPGDKIVFKYSAFMHSVASVFASEFATCPPRVIPICWNDKYAKTKVAECYFEVPLDPENATYYFICTENDHCAVRGMRMKVIVGSENSYDCLKVTRGIIERKTCDPAPVTSNSVFVVDPPPNEPVDRPYSFNYGTSVRYTCNKGFAMEGFPVSTCLKSGAWSSQAPSCTKTDI